MRSPAVQVEGIGKQYHLGLREKRHQTFREAIVDLAAAPLRRLRHLSGRVEEEDSFWALRDVSFNVAEGEVLGIIGRNGAGKSTLLKILSRITEPTEGRATIHGRVASLLEVGTGFHNELTGRENVHLNGAILGMSKAEIDRKFDEIVEFSGVAAFLDTPIKRYSSGMKVRLAFAVAAHLEPEILIIDEVLAVGDAEFQRKCLGKMEDVARHGRTILFVSHDLVAVQKLCSRGVLLDSGIIQQIGQVHETIQEYLADVQQPVLEWFNTNGDGSSAARVIRVALCDDRNEPLHKITTATVPKLRIEVEINEERNDLRLALALCDSMQRPVFASCPPDSGLGHPTRPGIHCYVIDFCDALLMHQKYSLTVSLYSRHSGSFHQLAHVLSFRPELVSTPILEADQQRVGILQKMCHWSLTEE